MGNEQPALFGYLLLSYFVESLAVYAKGGGGTSFQAFQSDFNTAAIAVTVIPCFYFGDGLINFFDELTFAIAITQFQRHIGLLAGAVVGVGENRSLILHGVDGAVYILSQLNFHAFQYLAKVHKLLRTHVALPLFRFVRSSLFA